MADVLPCPSLPPASTTTACPAHLPAQLMLLRCWSPYSS